MEHNISSEKISEYRLGRKSNFWVNFCRDHSGANQAFHLQVLAKNRGGAKTLAVMLETTPVCPAASVTVRGEKYPLSIGWQEMRRGGVICFGGERRMGVDGGRIDWEMRWTPMHEEPGCVDVEMRVRVTPRREGSLQITFNSPLHQPEMWRISPVATRNHGALLAWSAYNKYGISAATTDSDPVDWDEERGGITTSWKNISLGGGKLLRFSLRFLSAPKALSARSALVRQYSAFAAPRLNRLDSVPQLDPEPAFARLTQPENSHSVGQERLYLEQDRAPDATYFAGYPYYPADALHVLAQRALFAPTDHLKRLVRFGSHAIAADFQVMGCQGESEPNKGAFWDCVGPNGHSDFEGGATHGIASNARIARALFLLFEQTGEPLLRQSALNICQWLILKQNRDGYFDGARVHATRGLDGDGKFLPQPCTLDGAEVIRPFVLAYRATANEVYIKAAWKIAHFLIDERLPEFDCVAPSQVARVLLGLAALNSEASNSKLATALSNGSAWLRVLPLDAHSPHANADQRHSGLFECARAGFELYALTHDPALLRYAFAALAAAPHESRRQSWQAMSSQTSALLALSCLLPDAQPDFDHLRVTFGWRTFAPDPATSKYVQVTASSGERVDYLPLVCRLNDQLLILVSAPPSVDVVTILKNGRRPLVRDLLTDAIDTETTLSPIARESWGRVGLFLIEP